MEAKSRKSPAYGFTMIEMLVVIAIIAILAATVIPIVSSKLTSAKEATCAANRRSLLTVLTMAYVDGDADAVKKTFGEQKSLYTCPFGGTIGYFVDESSGKVIITCSHLEAEIGDALTKLYGSSKNVIIYGDDLSDPASEASRFYSQLSAEQKDVLDSYRWYINYYSGSRGTKGMRLFFADKTVTKDNPFVMYKYDSSQRAFQCTQLRSWTFPNGKFDPGNCGDFGWNVNGKWTKGKWSDSMGD